MATTQNDIRAIYGKHARVSYVGKFSLVHLDNPTNELIERRTRAFDPDMFFSDDCPLCRALKESGIVVFDAEEDGNE